tara:strand:- start:51 stop:356 length:306 start_codon:yes stop_codon:yes gene_type:complete
MHAKVGVPYTDERLGIPGAMVDDDNMNGVEAQFSANASLEEGISGQKPIDTLFENTSEDDIDAPRSARSEVALRGKIPEHEGVDNPAPVQVNKYDYPHRKY